MAATEKRRSLQEQLSCRCKHFTGIMEKMCDAKVLYDDVRQLQPDGKGPEMWPCTNPALANCSKRELPTPEEVAAEEAEIENYIRRIIGTRMAIVAHAQGKRGVQGSFACPECKDGVLRYSIAECNEHIHARCSTKDCVAVME